jgi:hypothetical protein
MTLARRIEEIDFADYGNETKCFDFAGRCLTLSDESSVNRRTSQSASVPAAVGESS